MKHPFPIGIVLVVSLALVACTGSLETARATGPAEPSLDPSGAHLAPDASATPSGTKASSSTPVEPAVAAQTSPAPSPRGMTVVRAYFMLGGPSRSAGLVPVLREVPATTAVARAAMRALLEGPRDSERGASPPISSAVPAGTELLGVSIEAGVATVHLSGEFESGGGRVSQLGRLGQVVYTLTQFPTVKAVAFRVAGRSVRVFGSQAIVLDGPVGRADLVDGEPSESMFEALLPAIFVDGPAWGATLGHGDHVTGTANTYEAWLSVDLRDAAGRVLDGGPAQATCGTGCRGTFDLVLAYAVSEAQWGILRVLDGDESGTTQGVAREYPVWLTPGSPDQPCGC